MPRDFEALYRAQQQTTAAATRNESISLPPGYLVGFDVRLRQDYTVLITAGACNIRGRLVQIKEDHQLADADWVAPKINSTRHYYIYLSLAGQWFVDIVAPVWNNQYLYWEQPDTNWRAVGKVFISGGQLLFAIKEVEKNEQTVTVAPYGFTGKADYYCEESNNQILINAAIRYLHEAYDGGECRLIRGTYSVHNGLDLFDNITFAGESRIGTNIYMFGIYGYGIDLPPGCQNITVTRLSITKQQAGYPSIIINCMSNNSEISEIEIVGFSTGIWLSANNCIVKNNYLHDSSENTIAPSVGIYWYSGSDAIISENIIYNISNPLAFNVGIQSRVQGQIYDNAIFNVDNAGIYVTTGSYTQIRGNKVYSCGYGIYIAVATSYKVTDNFCYNNGSDTGIANTNQNNFYDAGTDTQVYSNSWQQPVAGEPSLGELKFHSRTTILSAVTVSASQSYTIGAATSGMPTGCNMIYLEVYGRPSGNCFMGFGPTTTNVSSYYYNWTGAYTSDHVFASVSSSGDFKIWNPSAGDWLFFYAIGRGYVM